MPEPHWVNKAFQREKFIINARLFLGQTEAGHGGGNLELNATFVRD